MKNIKISFLLIFFAFLALIIASSGTTNPQRRRYDNYAVFRAKIQTVQQHQLLRNLADQAPEKYNIWLKTRREIHIMVAPTERQRFKILTERAGIIIELLIANVQKYIETNRLIG